MIDTLVSGKHSAFRRSGGNRLGDRLATLILIGTIGRIVFGLNPAFAVCSDHSPISNESVTCDTSPPNPDLAGVTAVSGATNVTVNLLPGSGITVSDGVLLNGSSQATNQGTITISGDEFDGMTLRGTNNQLTKQGTINTSGMSSEGLFSEDPNNTRSTMPTVTSRRPAAIRPFDRDDYLLMHRRCGDRVAPHCQAEPRLLPERT